MDGGVAMVCFADSDLLPTHETIEIESTAWGNKVINVD
jgi:hypothetical protein